MASLPAKLSLILFFLFSLTLLLHANPTLHHSDNEALILLRFNIQSNRSQNPCNSVGIFCKSTTNPTLRVTRIVLTSKQLKGSLSPAIGQLSELKELSLPNNHLVDRIPSQIVDCHHLEVLNLRNNRFSGEIPPEISSLVSLRILDLSSNQFSGNLNFLNNLANLEKLYVSNNLFSGKIPVSLQTFTNLRFLNLSGNDNLDDSTWLSREKSLPKRYIFAENGTRNNSSRNRTISPAPSPLPASTQEHKKDNDTLKGWLIGLSIGVISGMASGFIVSVVIKSILVCMTPKVPLGPVIFSSMIKKAEDLAFLEQEDGLDSLELIGRGGCGEVFKKEIHGKMFAIKKIIQPSGNLVDLSEEDSKLLDKKMRQVRSEIDTVGQIRHRNLLSLLAHVPRPDCHYLVYEFMKNGSLHDILKQVSEGNGVLDWGLRHKIAVGVAAGLEYLHMHHNPRIIHRDLKPANILIDDNMEARIADFGLAATMPDANTHVTTSNVAGTVGFIAPEYHQTLKFTDKCDIYSFGVVLAVLVMGKMPSDEFFQNTEEMSMVKWLRNVMVSENPSTAIDLKLIDSGFEEQVLLVLKIAYYCTLDDPKQRPDSKDVGRMLAQVMKR